MLDLSGFPALFSLLLSLQPPTLAYISGEARRISNKPNIMIASGEMGESKRSNMVIRGIQIIVIYVSVENYLISNRTSKNKSENRLETRP